MPHMITAARGKGKGKGKGRGPSSFTDSVEGILKSWFHRRISTKKGQLPSGKLWLEVRFFLNGHDLRPSKAVVRVEAPKTSVGAPASWATVDGKRQDLATGWAAMNHALAIEKFFGSLVKSE